MLLHCLTILKLMYLIDDERELIFQLLTNSTIINKIENSTSHLLQLNPAPEVAAVVTSLISSTAPPCSRSCRPGPYDKRYLCWLDCGRSERNQLFRPMPCPSSLASPSLPAKTSSANSSARRRAVLLIFRLVLFFDSCISID